MNPDAPIFIQSADSTLLCLSLFQVLFCIALLLHAYGVGRKSCKTVLLAPPVFFAVGLLGAIGGLIVFGLELPLLSVALGVLTVLALCHPAYALSVFIFNLFLRPWEALGPGNSLEIMVKYLAAVSLFSLILHKVRSSSGEFKLSHQLLAFLGFMLWLIICAAFAPNSDSSMAYIQAAMIPAAVLVIVVFNSIELEEHLRVCLFSLAFSILAVATCAVSETTARNPAWTATTRLVSFGQWGNSNDLATLFVTALPFMIFGFLSPKARALAKFFYLVALFILGASLFFTQSRGGLLAFGASLVPIFFLRKRGPISWIAFGSVFVVIFCAIVFGITRDQNDLEGSDTSRFNYVITGLKMVRSHPLFGVGPGNYPLLYDSYTDVFVEFGQRTAHSSWVLVLSEAGPIGLVMFFMLVRFAFLKAWAGRNRYPEMLMALSAYFFSVTFLSHTYSISTYIVMALAACAGRSMQQRQI